MLFEQPKGTKLRHEWKHIISSSDKAQLTEIEEIKEKTDIELEIFVHGAMCMSYSGRCLSFCSYGSFYWR